MKAVLYFCFLNGGVNAVKYNVVEVLSDKRTLSGRDCMNWKYNYPHTVRRDYRKARRNGNVKNNCLRFSDGDRPWCYTTDPNTVFEYCKESGSLYTCDETTTQSGKETNLLDKL